jgi:hypothetical protein
MLLVKSVIGAALQVAGDKSRSTARRGAWQDAPIGVSALGRDAVERLKL